MSSLVCFPFKEEDVPNFVKNIQSAASHERVAAVICVGYSRGATWHGLLAAIPGVEATFNKPVILIEKARHATTGLRAGKGDGMNTALEYFLVQPERFARLHFYDSDITSFSRDWITKAEVCMDAGGYDVVRHYYPRAATDAMITWFVTKVGFALLWPNSVLPCIEQPLGGELCLSRSAVEVLFADKRVRDQSGWGIDTTYTFVAAQAGLRLAEVYIQEGKVHSLYGGLGDLKTMLCECFHAIQLLRHEHVPASKVQYAIEPSQPVPKRLKQKVGYDIEKTLRLLRSANWTPRQWELLERHGFDAALVRGLRQASEWPAWAWADEAAWVAAFPVFLAHFRLGDRDWEDLLFKVWVARVVNFTMGDVVRGYDVAVEALREMVRNTCSLARSSTKQYHANGAGEAHVVPYHHGSKGELNL